MWLPENTSVSDIDGVLEGGGLSLSFDPLL